MCAPMAIAAVAMAAASVYQTTQARKSAKEAAAVQAAAQGDPAAERAAAEAEAAQRANAQLAESNRRRREQGSLMAKGAPATPQFNFGDSSTSGPSNVLDSTGMTTRSSTARTASLMSRGTPSTVSSPGGAAYGRGTGGGGATKYGNFAL